MITSPHNSLIRLVERVRRGSRSARDLVLLEGWRCLEEALGSPVTIQAVLVAEEAIPRGEGLLDRARSAGAEVTIVSSSLARRLSALEGPPGVLALASRPSPPLEAIFLPPPALVVLALGIQDPGNMGALVRSARAAGATGVMAPVGTVSPHHPAACRGAMGCNLSLPVITDITPPAALNLLPARGLTLLLAVPRGGRRPEEIDMTGPMALVITGETGQVPYQPLLDPLPQVSIPMARGVDSLNVAVAASVLLFAAASARYTAGLPLSP